MKLIEDIIENSSSKYVSVLQKLISRLRSHKRKKLYYISQKYLVITGIDLWWTFQMRIDKQGIIMSMLFATKTENAYCIINFYEKVQNRLQQLYILSLMNQQELQKTKKYFEQQKGIQLEQYIKCIATDETKQLIDDLLSYIKTDQNNEYNENISDTESDSQDCEVNIQQLDQLKQINFASMNSYDRLSTLFNNLYQIDSKQLRNALGLQYFIATNDYENAIMLLATMFDGQEKLQKLCQIYSQLTDNNLKEEFQSIETPECQIICGLFP